MLVVRGKLYHVREKADGEEYVVGCLKRGVRFFGDLVHGECNCDQNQVLYDRFRGQGERHERGDLRASY